MRGTEESDFTRKELIENIVEILNDVENIKIIDYFYQFIKTAVTKWK